MDDRASRASGGLLQIVRLAALALTLSGCQSAPAPVVAKPRGVVATPAPAAMPTRSSEVVPPASAVTQPRRSLALATGSIQEPEVLPTTPAQIDVLCSYLGSLPAGPGRGSAEQALRDCKRAEQAALNERRMACIRSSASQPTQDRAAGSERCIRGPKTFEHALQDRKDFDILPQLATLPALAELGRRLTTTADRVGFLPEIWSRMNSLCAASQPQFISTAQWQAALDRYEVAGPGGSCAAHAQTARAALLNIEKSEERAALAAASTWKAVSAFIADFEPRDVAELLPVARQKLADARSTEISQMQAMPLDVLETFWREGSQLMPELKDLARTRLIDDSIADKTFAGALRAYRVSNDVSHVANSQRLVVTPADRRKLEEIAVAHTATPGRFFRLGFSASHGEPRRDEESHMGVFALYTMHGLIPVDGRVSVERARDAPGPLVHGQYRVLIDAEMTLHKGYSRQSRVLGNDDSVRDETIKKRIVVSVGAPAMSGSAAVDFGDIRAVWMKRGSSGGVEQEWVDADPVIRLSVVGVEVQ